MNRTKLKNYAPQARREFIQAVTDRAAFYGLSPNKIEPVTEKGDLAIIAGLAFPKTIAAKRKALEDRIKRTGFGQTMEALAYTWFNRLVAIRYMELHGYLEHGYRVLTNPDTTKDSPEILEHAEHVELPGLKRETIIDLKLAGNKEAELYRMLLVAQCNALHSAMPFLFERIDDETELVLPDSLLHTGSIVRKLISDIDEEDWQNVEIIGWIYQFYISEKKDEVIGKVVKSEDIPAATQLFTPNWIVKYLVQNTLGRQWLATYPQSSLRQQMEYYIEPAEQTPEVQEQLKAIMPTTLNPGELTLLDPACGSGHILVEAYDIFKAIYQERGYRAKDIPALILQKNLFGLEIDDRAAQLAAFALLMKARADDRTVFDSESTPSILAFQNSHGLNAADITHALNSPINKEPPPPSEYLIKEIEDVETPLFSKQVPGEKGHVTQADIATLLALFENAKTFGSLIQVPPNLAARLPEIEKRLADVLKHGDLTHAPARVLNPLLRQARLLARQYDAVVTNPPYMGTKYLTPILKQYLQNDFDGFDKDLYSSFIIRSRSLAVRHGILGFMAPFTWMFISSHEQLRRTLIAQTTLNSLIQLEYSGFDGATVPICTFTFTNVHVAFFKASFIRLTAFKGAENQGPKTLDAIRNRKCGWFYEAHADDFPKVPGSPIAYWISDRARDIFATSTPLENLSEIKQGLATCNNGLFLRLWHEVGYTKIGFGMPSSEAACHSEFKWFPYNKGGGFRKWYGNNNHLVNWENNGKAIHDYSGLPLTYAGAPVRAKQYYFREGITYGLISSFGFSARRVDQGFVFDVGGSMIFPSISIATLHGFLTSKLTTLFVNVLNPTLNYQVGDICNLPIIPKVFESPQLAELSEQCVSIAKTDWDSFETSWDFQLLPLLQHKAPTVQSSQEFADTECLARSAKLKEREEENNRRFIEAYDLQGELTPEVPDELITLYRPDREEDIKRLLSYTIGCMMGRYSLDKPGLIYLYSGNQEFDPSQYKTFRADDDGIIPLLETDWGIRDDAANRVVEFVSVAWPKEHLEENLSFVAESLGAGKDESTRETIRKYLSTRFYKYHLSMYKKRPIYWLFSSGKQRAFQCLVYLHRYNESTLGRMRTEYVIPLQGNYTSRIDQLATDITNASSTSHRNKLVKERDKLIKQQAELKAFDEKLRHYADQRIALDLDDGVKVNYAKFGDLLAEVKAITGGSADE